MKLTYPNLKTLLLTVLTASTLAAASGCAKKGKGDKGAPAAQPAGEEKGGMSEKKILASNVVYMDAQQALALQDPTIDTTTKVLAQNVMFANAEGKSDLKSNNVEGALVESNLDLRKLVPGSWRKTLPGTKHVENLDLNADGTATTDNLGLAEDVSIEYEIEDDLIVMTYTYSGSGTATGTDQDGSSTYEKVDDGGAGQDTDTGTDTGAGTSLWMTKTATEVISCAVFSKTEKKLILLCNGAAQIWTR